MELAKFLRPYPFKCIPLTVSQEQQAGKLAMPGPVDVSSSSSSSSSPASSSSSNISSSSSSSSSSADHSTGTELQVLSDVALAGITSETGDFNAYRARRMTEIRRAREEATQE